MNMYAMVTTNNVGDVVHMRTFQAVSDAEAMGEFAVTCGSTDARMGVTLFHLDGADDHLALARGRGETVTRWGR